MTRHAPPSVEEVEKAVEQAFMTELRFAPPEGRWECIAAAIVALYHPAFEALERERMMLIEPLAQLERMRVVVEAARDFVNCGSAEPMENFYRTRQALDDAVDALDAEP